jgi:hypothetical protein
VISDFCGSCAAELDESASSISFGFRTIHKDRMCDAIPCELDHFWVLVLVLVLGV